MRYYIYIYIYICKHRCIYYGISPFEEYADIFEVYYNGIDEEGK